jgi:MFS family permease
MDIGPTPQRGVGHIAARIDRLPLTWAQWQLALISQIFWGVIIAADGIPARVYPFIWGPQHDFGPTAFSILLAMQFGVGILVGEYLIGMVADRWGRRMALLMSSLAMALLLWPTALTHNFAVLMVFFGLSSIGMGGVLATNVVYMGEIVPPRDRGRVMLASQILAVVVFGVLGNVPAILWIPAHYDYYIYFYSVVTMLVLVPLALWALPESPRWLEAHGRHDQAERVTAKLEAECLRRSGQAALPDPDYARYTVPVTRHVPVRELLRGEYGKRTIVLLCAWVLGYSGIVYGLYGFQPAILRGFGLSADQTFEVILVSAVVGGGLGLAICSVLGRWLEPRTTILLAALVNVAAVAAFYFFHSLTASFVLMAIIVGGETAWLFCMYNYTAASYPTRLRATGTGLTDGIGHLGSIVGPLVAGALFTATAGSGYIGWFLFITIPGALLPAILVASLGINQRRAILEHISA